MAFTFTVETGAVVAGANSYVPVAFATDYFDIDPNFKTIWAAFSAADKEIFLAWASRTADQKVQWRGTKTVETSALRWPREGVRDRDGEDIAKNTIPLQLKQFVCELVKYMRNSDPTTTQDVENVKRMKLDVMEIEFQEGTAQATAPPILSQLLVGIGSWPSGLFGFGRIRRA